VPQSRTVGDQDLPAFDPRVPSPARIWNYWLGGKDNFAADREAGQRVLEAMSSATLTPLYRGQLPISGVGGLDQPQET